MFGEHVDFAAAHPEAFSGQRGDFLGAPVTSSTLLVQQDMGHVALV